MIGTKNMVRLMGVACVLTLAIGAGAAMAKPADAGVKMAASEEITVGTSEKSGLVEASSPAALPDCARKVKVVYAGYGEAARASCAGPTASQ